MDNLAPDLSAALVGSAHPPHQQGLERLLKLLNCDRHWWRLPEA
jgi:hypothetical protein